MAIKQKNLIKKLAVSIMLLVVMVSSTAALSSYAYVDNNNIGFSFQIVPGGKVSKNPTSRYRSTSDPTNAWKVSMQNSTESSKGAKTYTMFHLGIDNPNGINPMGSDSYYVQLGKGYYYRDAYATASKKDVYLYGKDNMKSLDFYYSVSGHWDEETGERAGYGGN